jgi:hypothetical protein
MKECPSRDVAFASFSTQYLGAFQALILDKTSTELFK